MWNVIQAERLTNDRFGFALKGESTLLKQCWTSGTTLRASSTRFALTTGISTFFDNKHRHPMECGIWFHFGELEIGPPDDRRRVKWIENLVTGERHTLEWGGVRLRIDQDRDPALLFRCFA